MELEFFTEETSEDENYLLDNKIEDYMDFDGERCGICMEIVVDRGVLDCCQHWFCFACIDNWATITSLCPLCQNEFQLITCVPVYDTVGGNKTDEETNQREDDWFVEGKNNSLSFPSYYIDENAVVCLDGDGCKIRSGSVTIEEDSDIDTSIACDSCDQWYHAFCVGFDPDGTCDSSWLCPRCCVDKVPQKPERSLVIKQSYQQGLKIASDGSQVEDSFPGRVSVSIADDGETAVVVSLVEGHPCTQESSKLSGCRESVTSTILSSSTLNMSDSTAPFDTMNSSEPNSGQQVGLSPSQDCNFSSPLSSLSAQLNIDADSAEKRVIEKSINSNIDFDHGLPVRSYNSVKVEDREIAKDHEPDSLERKISHEECSLTADKMVPDNVEMISLNSMISDKKASISRSTGAKRKLRDSRKFSDGEREAKLSQKKMKAERNSQPKDVKDQTLEFVLGDSRKISSGRISQDSKLNNLSEKVNGKADIMSIVQGTDRRSLKQVHRKISSDATPKDKETAAGLRLKKIMRRSGYDKDSSVLVQELRGKIRDAVRNKSSEEIGQNLFDPKLLDAFRAALAGSGTENTKPILDVKAKKSMLQKGKVRESLTKKIYRAGGKRQRAWNRECEVEFWRHRCLKTGKPEKVQTLKSVLDLLRDDSGYTKKMPGDEEEQRSSVLSRLYLADNSVFPRKNDIMPVSAQNATVTPEQIRESGLKERDNKSSLIVHPDRIPSKNNNSTQVIVPPSDSKGTKKSAKGMTVTPEKEEVSKADSVKGDKRKWALELLARKTAAPGKNGQDKEEDKGILKGNYPLLAQLPKDMRPVLAPTCHNKIPMPVRQAQLYRLTELFLKKADLAVVCRTAETELAVADAVNIEKEVADRSNSKLVYVNLCSQELLRRSDSTNSRRVTDPNPCSTSEEFCGGVSEEAKNSSLNLAVDEALRNAGLTSDSPPESPTHLTEGINNEADSPEQNTEGPDNILEDSHPELDIYGDFEYNLEDDDFIGAGALNISKPHPEEPKIKLVFSSLNTEKPDATLEPLVHEQGRDVEACHDSACLLESQHKDTDVDSTEACKKEESLVQNSLVDGSEEPSIAECEELYGPDREPLFVKNPIVSITMDEQTVNSGLNEEIEDCASKRNEKNSRTDSNCSISKESPANLSKTEHAKKTSKSVDKQSETSNSVVKKVEAYIKEHLRPLCKSGVITVEQYRWAVGKTTEKVMKYHSKEKSANFLIKEGEKVKKLAQQYVEAAPAKAKS